MDKIEWSDGFSVGVKTFDDQHKRILGLVNKLIDTPNLDSNSVIITEMISKMIDYAKTHFEDEERLMLEHNYPDYIDQRVHHGEFIEKTGAFIEQTAQTTSEGEESVPESILIYLEDWWINHILKEDMAYKPFFKDKEIV